MMMPDQMTGMLGQLKANPFQFLARMKMNLPQNMNVSDPQEILNYLVKTGQVSQNQINSAYQMMQRMSR